MKKFLLVLTMVIPFLGFAQKAGESIDYFLPKGNYTLNSEITTPEQFLHHEIAAYHVTTPQVYDYMELLTKESDRFSYEYHGRTYQNRPLMYLTITSPKNRANLDKIMEEHMKLSDPTYKGELDYDNMPVVIWLGYSIHGNEASGINAGLAVAYYLAAAQGESIDNILENSVIIFHPIINPDGSDRFASWVNTARSYTTVTDPNTREFNEPWPGSRTNHYWFDLNRDILYIQHPESRSKVEMYQRWMPNVVADHHEQGSDSHFFFMPGFKTGTNPITHKDNYGLTKEFGKFHAKELDNIQSIYFSGTNFDDFYYGKGSTYPDIHGAVGMLFEQGSARGHIRMTKNGILSLAMATRNQAYTSFSSINAGIALRKELLKHQRDSYTEAYNEALALKFSGYVIGGDDTKGTAYHVVDILTRQGIDVYKLKSDVNQNGINYKTDNSYYIPAAQKEVRKIKTMFENETNFLDSAFYDITAWSISEASNLKAAKVKGDYKGAKITTATFEKGSVIGGESKFGYLFPNNEYYSTKVVYELQRAGLRVKVSSTPFDFKVDGVVKHFTYGTVMLQASNQELDYTQIYKLVSSLANKYGVDIYSVATGMGEDTQLGQSSFKHLTMPRTAMIVGTGMNTGDSGEIWYLLDNRMQIPLANIDVSRVSKNSLEPYNTLIIAGSPYTLSESQRQAIKDWVTDGGTLIALSGAWQFTNSLGLTDLTTHKNVYADEKGSEPRAYSNQFKERVGRAIGGVILDTHIDPSHPLCYGYTQDNLSVFHRGTYIFNDIKDGFNVPVRYTSSPVVSGYVSKDNVKNIADSPSVLAGSAGRGRVIVFNCSPNFRGFWYGTQKMFYNAMFYGKIISAQKLASIKEEK